MFAWMEDFTEFDDPQELSCYLAVRTMDIVKIAEKHVLDIHLSHERWVSEDLQICKREGGRDCLVQRI